MVVKKSLKEIYEQVPPDYYEEGIKKNIFQWIWHNWKWKTLKDFLQRLDSIPKKVLDVGCSSGHITSRIAQFFNNSEVLGVDVYKKAINYGRKIHPEVKFFQVDVHDLPFQENTFDLVICIETIEHVLDPKKAINEIWRVLVPRGIFIVAQDTDSFLFNAVWFLWTKTRGKVWTESHLHPFKPKELEKLFEDLGFGILEKKYSQLGLEIFIKCLKI